MKQIKVSSFGIWAAVVIVLAILLRITLTALGWPPTNSDESKLGIMAMHIDSFKDFPIMLYGQVYMGALEAYIAAVLFPIFGASLLSLRLGTTLLFALFLTSMYFLVSLLYTKKFALVTLVLLSIGSIMMLFTELMAHGGYPEILGFGAMAFLLASYLALSSGENAHPHGRRRMLAFSCWGLVVALGFWSDYAILSIVLISGLLLVLFCWRELWRGAIWPLFLGLLIGSIPLIIYNLQVPSGQNSLIIMWRLHNDFNVELAQSPVYSHFPLPTQIWGTILVSLPMATGAPPICFDSDWVVLGQGGGLRAFQCLDIHGEWSLAIIGVCWSLGYIALWLISTLHELKILWKLKQPPFGRLWSPEKRRVVVRHFARLALLAMAGLTLLEFTLSPVAAVFPAAARYLTALLIAIPAVIAPLWDLSHDTNELDPADSKKAYSNGPTPMSTRTLQTAHLPTIKLVVRRGILLLIGVVYLIGSISIFFELPTVQAVDRQQQALIQDLLSIHVTHVYTDYWTCYRLAFLSKERLICTTYGGQSPKSYISSPGYDAIVKNDPDSAYMFSLGSSVATIFAEQAVVSSRHYLRFVFEGYVVYQPMRYSRATGVP